MKADEESDEVCAEEVKVSVGLQPVAPVLMSVSVKSNSQFKCKSEVNQLRVDAERC